MDMCSLVTLQHLRKNKTSKPPEPSIAEAEYPSKKRSHKEETNLCRTILRLMLRHEDALPFLTPVDKKKVNSSFQLLYNESVLLVKFYEYILFQFPGYYKVITHPMDFKTMKHKLDNNK